MTESQESTISTVDDDVEDHENGACTASSTTITSATKKATDGHGQNVASTAETSITTGHAQQPTKKENKKRAACQFHTGKVFNKVVLVINLSFPLFFKVSFFFHVTHRSTEYIRGFAVWKVQGAIGV